MSLFAGFTSEPIIQFAKDESLILGHDVWRVMEGIKYYISGMDSPAWVDVPRGYLIDGASVPRLLWTIIPPWGAYGAATIVHDKLCEYLSITVDGLPQSITRKVADDILAEAMRSLGVNARDQDLINTAVAAYRTVARVKDPVWQRKKAELEAQWAAANMKLS